MKITFRLTGLLPILLLFQSQLLFGQIGFSINRFSQDILDWESGFANASNNSNSYQDLLSSGYSVGVDYWLKPLKDYRLELYPEIVFSRSTDEFSREFIQEQFTLTTLGFNLNANIYPFNFLSDCDCPTFSKQETFIEKGLFLQISPGFHFYHTNHDIAEGNITTGRSEDGWIPKLGIGLGIDIGVSDLITVSPIIKYNRFFGADWEDFSVNSNGPFTSHSSPINQLTYGLHIGVRWRK